MSYELGSERADMFSYRGQQATVLRGKMSPQRNVRFSEEKIEREKEERYTFSVRTQKRGQASK